MRDLRCFCRLRRSGLSSSPRSSRSLPDLAECLDLRLVRLGLLSWMARNHSVDEVDVLSIRLRNVLERLEEAPLTIARMPARIASGSSGQATTTAARSASLALEFNVLTFSTLALSLAFCRRFKPDSFGSMRDVWPRSAGLV